MNKKLIVIAIGGNAILKENQKGTVAEQFENVRTCCGPIVELYEKGYRIVLVHGNGPQVGNILLQAEAAADTVPVQTIDLCGAQTQGQIGYMLQLSMQNSFREKGVDGKITSVVTQMVVDRQDPAFQNPTKPIGPFFSNERAEKLREERPELIFKEDAGRGYRRVVPSPKPLQVIEADSVSALLRQGHIVVTCGGGGIPVSLENGQYQGVEAVIDKDLAAALLAQDIKADMLVILTGVDQVYVDFGKPSQKAIFRMTASQALAYMEQGQFPEGSMKPKIQAALNYLKGGGEEVLITSMERLTDALLGNTGTIVCRDGEAS